MGGSLRWSRYLLPSGWGRLVGTIMHQQNEVNVFVCESIGTANDPKVLYSVGDCMGRSRCPPVLNNQDNK